MVPTYETNINCEHCFNSLGFREIQLKAMMMRRILQYSYMKYHYSFKKFAWDTVTAFPRKFMRNFYRVFIYLFNVNFN